jgi:hypothetical protein
MGRDKATMTLDRANASEVRTLLGARSTSEAIDQALDQVISTAQLQADVEADRRVPPTPGEIAIGRVGDPGSLDDDTDWDAIYPERKQ